MIHGKLKPRVATIRPAVSAGTDMTLSRVYSRRLVTRNQRQNSSCPHRRSNSSLCSLFQCKAGDDILASEGHLMTGLITNAAAFRRGRGPRTGGRGNAAPPDGPPVQYWR